MLTSQNRQQKHAQTVSQAWSDRQESMLGQLKSNDVYLTAGTVSISAQIEAAVKACEAETARVGQDYYSALSASSPTAAKGPAAGKSPAPAKGKSAKEEPAAPTEVVHIDTYWKFQEPRQSFATVAGMNRMLTDGSGLRCQHLRRPSEVGCQRHSCRSAQHPRCMLHLALYI